MPGSPPHTWRIQKVQSQMHQLIRITSTYVENTVWTNPPIGCPQDHLHIRGEYLKIINLQVMLKGSPPHTWRIRKLAIYKRKTTRITSTYVENTDLQEMNQQWQNGSPPHTWRIPDWRNSIGWTTRITSTYVENTNR